MRTAPIPSRAAEAALPSLPMPVCCNGDLVTVRDCRAIASRFPGASALMLGRGLMADPALARKLRGGPDASREELDRIFDFIQGSVADDKA